MLQFDTTTSQLGKSIRKNSYYFLIPKICEWLKICDNSGESCYVY